MRWAVFPVCGAFPLCGTARRVELVAAEGVRCRRDGASPASRTEDGAVLGGWQDVARRQLGGLGLGRVQTSPSSGALAHVSKPPHGTVRLHLRMPPAAPDPGSPRP